MDFSGFRLVGLRECGLDDSGQRTIGQILEEARLVEQLPRVAEVLVEVGRTLARGLTLPEAHETWVAEYFPKVQTPPGLPRRESDQRTPDGLVRVGVSLIRRRTTPASYYGFNGHFVSLLVLPQDRAIWDARWEEAM